MEAPTVSEVLARRMVELSQVVQERAERLMAEVITDQSSQRRE